MEKSCLVTASLISSISWTQTAPNTIIKSEKGGDGVTTWKVKAIQDLKNTLARKPFTPNDAAKHGIVFENALYKKMSQNIFKDPDSSDFFNEILSRLAGGQVQRKNGKQMVIGEYNCYLYAKEDVYFPDKIIDIKTTEKYSREKYTGSIQHYLYSVVEDIYTFEYLVAEWKKYPEIKSVYGVALQYTKKEALAMVEEVVKEAFAFLKKTDLWDLYRDSYCLY